MLREGCPAAFAMISLSCFSNRSSAILEYNDGTLINPLTAWRSVMRPSHRFWSIDIGLSSYGGTPGPVEILMFLSVI